MMDNNFEAALSEFLDRHEYDDAEAASLAALCHLATNSRSRDESIRRIKRSMIL